MVSLTISEILGGAQVSDALEGGGTGVDLGAVVNNSFAPLVDKSTNDGAQQIYVRHDATIDPITDFKLHIQTYGVGTGFTYGGANSAAADYSALIALGAASGSSKNNGDGLSGGFWVDMDWNVAQASQFDHGTRPTLVKIFGDNSTDGIDLPSAFTVAAEAMSWNNTGVETEPTGEVAGKIGKSGDTVLGDVAHLRFRAYLPDSHTDGGIMQWETVFSYSFTA